MGIPVTRTDPPAAGMVRLQPEFGRVRFGRNGYDHAFLSAQIGDEHVGIEITASSDGPGPGDFKTADVTQALRDLAAAIDAKSHLTDCDDT